MTHHTASGGQYRGTFLVPLSVPLILFQDVPVLVPLILFSPFYPVLRYFIGLNLDKKRGKIFRKEIGNLQHDHSVVTKFCVNDSDCDKLVVVVQK